MKKAVIPKPLLGIFKRIIMKIYCSGCDVYLGDIIEGRLRKRISHLCNVCEDLRLSEFPHKRSRTTENTNKPEPTPVYNEPLKGDLFSDIFGDIFGGNKK